MTTPDLTRIEQQALGHLAEHDFAEAMRVATRDLNRLRSSHERGEWRSLANSELLHGLRTQLHEDPYTHRGFVKPRGYAGDAVLVDFIYGVAPLPDDTTDTGRAIFGWCSEHSDAFRAVRQRCRRMAALIDAEAAEKPDLRVLSVACGHLREALLSKAVVGGHVAELVGLDHDAESLRVVGAATRGLPVRTVHAPVKALLQGRLQEHGFDVIYATGLFDYLGTHVARALVRDLADRLRPGGRLVIGNFQQMWEAAYIEAFMDWWLIYRTPDALRDLANDLPSGFVSRVDIDEHDVIAYLQITRET